MNEYILSIIGVVFLTTIAGIILPEGKLGQYIKSIFSILSIIIIITPILKFSTKDFDYSDIFKQTDVVCQQNFFDYVYNQKAENLKKNIDVLLNQKGFSGVDINIIYEVNDGNFKITKILLNLQKVVIIGDNQHINISEEIKQAVADYAGIDKSLVVINE